MYDTKNGLTTSGLIFGLVASLLILLLPQVRVFDPLNPFIKASLGSLQFTNIQFFKGLESDLAFLSGIGDYRTENDRLSQENLNLQAENVRLQELLKDYGQISRQMSFNREHEVEPVRVINFSESQTEILINKGADFGIKINDVAVVENNLAGVVVEVASNYARVRLLSDKASRIPAVVVDTGGKGLLQGEGGSVLTLREVPNEKLLEKGFFVVAAGTDAVVPYGVVLGRVELVQPDPTRIDQRAEVRSMLKFNDLLELFIIKKEEI
jgi:rod shape-determining protein MreC